MLESFRAHGRPGLICCIHEAQRFCVDLGMDTNSLLLSVEHQQIYLAESPSLAANKLTVTSERLSVPIHHHATEKDASKKQNQPRDV
jgi:hypothetical protein